MLIPSVFFLLSICAANAEAGASSLVSPTRSDAIASPLTFRNIQTSTESDADIFYLDPAATPLRIRTGLETYLSSRTKTYNLPVHYAFTPYLQTQLNVPLVTATTDSSTGGSATETGVGDISLSIKLNVNMDNIVEFYYIFTAKLPSGNPGNGLGTGAYDFSFTHKTITTFGDYRTTFMLGVTVPPPINFSIMGSEVEYAPTISYMAATEREIPSSGFRFALKAAGLHAFNSRINSVYQANAVTTLDIIPEVTYNISKNSSFNAGIIFPLVTIYELPGASDRRDPQLNFSIYKVF
jgi:hypothetical protein